jgi:hypothetical protein
MLEENGVFGRRFLLPAGFLKAAGKGRMARLTRERT